MVKFIVEVSEEYIAENADTKRVMGEIVGKTGIEGVNDVVDVMVFMFIKTFVDKGEKEFVLKEANIKKKEMPMFKELVSQLAVMTKILARKYELEKKYGNDEN